jgi:PAS domain S-box-containing protein
MTDDSTRPEGASQSRRTRAAAGLCLASLLLLAAAGARSGRSRRAALLEALLAAATTSAALGFILSDLSERRRLHAELILSRSRLEAVLENVRAPVFIKDRDGRFLLVNREYERVFGRPRAEILGRTNADFMPLEAARPLMEDDAEVLRRGEPVEIEERVETAAGPRTFLALKFPVPGPAGAVELGGVATDITTRKERETRLAALNAELDAARALLRAVLDAVPASVYLIGTDGTLRFVNKECARTLGGTPETIAGRTIREIFSADDAEKVVENNRRIHAGRKMVEVEEEVVSADGPRVYLSLKTPLELPPEAPPTLCGVSTDITERKRSERRLAEANADLESFSYSVSHDLRAPLRAIDGFARLLAAEHAAALDAEGLRMLGRVRANVDKMGALIDDLLSFSRLGRQDLRVSTVDMSALARLAADEAGAAEPARTVRLSLGPMPEARGDARMFGIVWTNLFSNAFKYTRPRAEAHIEAGGETGPFGTRYWVRDDGVGFDARYADKLFGVFQRLHRAEDFEGTGVGLALVRRVVERHGGRVEADGAQGCGAEFRFILPPREDA